MPKGGRIVSDAPAFSICPTREKLLFCLINLMRLPNGYFFTVYFNGQREYAEWKAKQQTNIKQK